MDLGKHVYVQKPLTWSVAEARQLARKAKANPEGRHADGQSGPFVGRRADGYRVRVGRRHRRRREVHVWTNRPLGYWPRASAAGSAHAAAERIPLERSWN
jgi:hypothetical protein